MSRAYLKNVGRTERRERWTYQLDDSELPYDTSIDARLRDAWRG